LVNWDVLHKLKQLLVCSRFKKMSICQSLMS
jgi:hypothetical protein